MSAPAIVVAAPVVERAFGGFMVTFPDLPEWTRETAPERWTGALDGIVFPSAGNAAACIDEVRGMSRGTFAGHDPVFNVRAQPVIERYGGTRAHQHTTP